MKYNYLVILCISAFFSLSACADNGIAVPSSWVNTEGSILTISAIDSAGQITGSYVNKASGWNCQNIVYPVTGWIYGTAITFDTKWESTTESCNSITSWAGFLYQGQINTFWNLTQNGSSSTSQILQGKDSFKPVSKVLKKSLVNK
jgi:hypothetical protein